MDFRLPEIGEGVYEAELIAWLVKAGDSVKRGQSLMELMTDKATMEVPSPFAGTVTALQAEPGSQIKVGQAILTYAHADETAEERNRPAAPRFEMPTPPKTEPAPPRPTATPAAGHKSKGRGNGAAEPLPRLPVKAAPSVRLMARKMGLDLSRMTGSGPEGRILIEDLAAQAPRPTANGDRPPEEPRIDYGKPGTRVKLLGLRRRIAEHMVLSKRTIPHYSYVDECDVTELVRLRESLREPFAARGVKLTYLAYFVKAAAAALQEVPIVNASLDESAGEIVLHDRYHIGIAVATPQGLIVPVIRDANRKDLLQIARDIERLSTEARTGKVKLDDLRGGTFTVTSTGNIGGLFATPIINHPEVGILGVGKVVKRPVFDDTGNVRPAELVYLSFSFDHRVVDGAVGAAFGNALISQLRHAAAMLLPPNP